MIKSIKLRTIAIITAAVLLVAGVCGAIVGITAATRIDNGLTVVLDAGHGGMDGGVSGKNTGIKESDINLAVTRALKDFLIKAGYKVVLTRKNSEGLYGAADRNKKMADMQKRKEIITEAKPDMVVSIHQNFYPLKSVYGPQVFYSPDSETGKEYAAILQSTLNAGAGTNRVAMKEDYYIINCSPYPSLLVECGFLSNPEEEALLVSAEYQQKIAYLIFSGIHAVLSKGGSNYDYLYNA